jgi:RNA polymerase sigma factor (sigma-70 family)
MQQHKPTATVGTTTEELFERHSASIFTYLRQHTREREDAGDILVDTFLAAMEDREFARLPESSQVAWLWRVARNKTVNVFRQAAVRRGTSLEQVDETISEEETQDPEQMSLRQDEVRQVRDLLRQLPPLQQDLLRLRFGYDLRCTEIAVILGKREQAVRTMLSRTIKHHIVGLQGTFLNASPAWVTVETSENIHIRLLHTTDGGKHWDIAFTPIQGFVIGHPDFINEQEGWLEIGTGAATGNEGVDIYRTMDGGKIWAKLSSTDFQTGKAPGHLPWEGVKSGISFLNAETGFETGSAGGAPNVFWFYVTHDGGATWQQQNLTWPRGLVDPSASLSPPLFFGEDGLLPILINDATHHTLVLYISHDGGATLQSTALGPGASILDASDANHIWTTDTHMLFVTSDGGYRWNQVVPHVDFTNVLALDVISGRVGWAIGGRERPQPLLLKTADGDRTWTEITYSIS